MTYKNILKKNSLRTDVLPLWKLTVTPEDYSDLKEELRKAFRNGSEFRLAKEAALCYAEWWRKEYVGGSREDKPSKEKIALSVGLQESKSEILYKLAKNGLRQLRIPVIVRNRREPFITLLLQGGLPINSLKNNQNNSNYKAFLEGLIKHTNTYRINWNDPSFIDSLPVTNRLSPSFRNNEIYELSLQIVEDLKDNGENGNYGELLKVVFTNDERKQLIELSKKSDNSRTRRGLFSIEWHIKKNDAGVSLHYEISLLPKIKSIDIPEQFHDKPAFTVVLNNKPIGKYIRTMPNQDGVIHFILKQGNNILNRWDENGKIEIKLSDNEATLETIENKMNIPDFTEPLLLNGAEYNWFIQKQADENDKNAILLLNDSEWRFVNVDNVEKVSFNGESASWVEFDGKIELINKENEETVILDNTPCAYNYELRKPVPLKGCTHKLIDSSSQFNVYYIPDDKRMQVGYKISYRTKTNKEWRDYTSRTNLPAGLISFKFIFPDKKEAFAKYFNIGNLRYALSEQTANAGCMTFENWPGTVKIYENQRGIKSFDAIRPNKWRIERDYKVTFFASGFKAKLTAISGDSTDIFIPTPFKGIVLTDIESNIVEPDRYITIGSLWKYEYQILDEAGSKIRVSHNKNRLNIYYALL